MGHGGPVSALWFGPPPVIVLGWDSYNVDAAGVSRATLHMDIPYDPSLGGYGLGILLEAYAEGEYGGTGIVERPPYARAAISDVA